MRRQHKEDIVDPSSIIELFQQHPADISPVDTIELIRMQEVVALFIRPGMHVEALTQSHPVEHGEAGRVQHGFKRRPLQEHGKVQGLHELSYFRMRRRHFGSEQFINDHYYAAGP